MRNNYQPRHLDVNVLAEQAAELSGSAAGADVFQQYPRVAQDAPQSGADVWAEAAVRWRVRGESRTLQGGQAQHWMHLEIDSHLPRTCQRCLLPVSVPLLFGRSYRFVADEAEAAREDLDAEEEVLVSSRQFDLLELVEDELLMEMPMVAFHAQCPVHVPMSALSPDFVSADGAVDATGDAGKPHPFAALARLKIPPG